jgi:hypothetical protein
MLTFVDNEMTAILNEFIPVDLASLLLLLLLLLLLAVVVVVVMSAAIVITDLSTCNPLHAASQLSRARVRKVENFKLSTLGYCSLSTVVRT